MDPINDSSQNGDLALCLRSEQQKSHHINKAPSDLPVGKPIPHPESNSSGDPDTRRPLRRCGFGVVSQPPCLPPRSSPPRTSSG